MCGGFQIRDLTDKEGGKRRSAEVVVDNIYFGDSKKSVSGERPPQSVEFEEVEDDGFLPF